MPENTGSENRPHTGAGIRAFRRRLLTGGLIISIVGLPIGIALGLPFVWGLSIIGIIVASIKLATMSR